MDVQKNGHTAWAGISRDDGRRIMIDSVQSLAPVLGVAPACTALGVPRSTVYRRQRPVR